MKRILSILLLVTAAVSMSAAQKRFDTTDTNTRREMANARLRAIAEANEAKEAAAAVRSSKADVSDFYDEDSFDENAKFLGSFYAGTLYTYHSCDPAVLLNEIGLVLAADDQCSAHSPSAPMATAIVDDPLWQITIPKKTVKNVIYIMMNKGIGYDALGATPGFANYFFWPRVTIISEALNHPLAIDPNTGLPMNGSYVSTLAGSTQEGFFLDNSRFSYTNQASISSRGLSRDYLAALGLPQSVIDNFFKKEIKLQFGFRARVSGPIDYGQFFYTYRLLGQ